jgi:hypothetical protein
MWQKRVGANLVFAMALYPSNHTPIAEYGPVEQDSMLMDIVGELFLML